MDVGDCGKDSGKSSQKAFICGSPDNKVHPELKSYFGYCLLKAAHLLRTRLDKALEPLGIIAPQLGMLKLIVCMEPVNQVELGQAMNIDKASMVKFVDLLEGRGLIQRKTCTEDRRVKYLSITKKGSQLLQKAIVIREKVEDDFFAPLTTQERQLLQKTIPRLVTD